MPLKLENKKQEILDLLDKGYNTNDIARELDEYQQAVRNVIKKYKPELSFIKNKGNAPNYFTTIDTHAKSYFLGFIAADGAIVKNTNSNTYELTITIHNKDIDILNFFKKELNCDHKISNNLGSNKNLCRFRISDKQLTKDLFSLGIVPNKSLILSSFINKIPNEFFNSFLLGYFDGDGSIYITKSKKYYINIRGTENLLTDYLTYFNINKKLYKYDSTFQLVLGSKEHLFTFFNKLYKDSPIYLKRKHEIFQNFLKEKCQDKTISSPCIST